MMSRKTLGIVLVAGGLIAFFAGASAISPDDIVFPVAELGGCEHKDACKAYCDVAAHRDACLAFAAEHNLIPKDEIERAKRLPRIGPGGCAAPAECRIYCDDTANAEECLQFAEKHQILDTKELARAREFVGQTGPGGCRGANDCRQYCEDAAHREECLEFGKRKGLISDQRADIALSILREGGPGGCREDRACRQYCEVTEHVAECVEFAERHDLIDPDKAAEIKKLSRGEGPGGCTGEACREFCDDPAHAEICITFAREHGLMTDDEATRAMRLSERTGPGECRGLECREFCEQEEHRAACHEFALREGLLAPDAMHHREKLRETIAAGGPGGCADEETCMAYCEDPAHQETCLAFAKRHALFEPGDESRFEAASKLREAIHESGGPGGCASEGACKERCANPEHFEACVAFRAVHGGLDAAEAEMLVSEFEEHRFDAERDFSSPETFENLRRERQMRIEAAKRRLDDHRNFERQFETPMPMGGEEGERSGMPAHESAGEMNGPGGCRGALECRTFCAEHPDACGRVRFERREMAPMHDRPMDTDQSAPSRPDQNFRPVEGMREAPMSPSPQGTERPMDGMHYPPEGMRDQPMMQPAPENTFERPPEGGVPPVETRDAAPSARASIFRLANLLTIFRMLLGE